MPIRFQADADFNQIIVSAVVRRHQEIDVRTATVAGLAGLIVVPQILAIRDAADALILIWAATKPEEWVNRVAYLPI